MYRFEFILTEICDWNCPYCAFTAIQKPRECNKKDLQKDLSIISKFLHLFHSDTEYSMMVQGGEIGLVKKEILDIFFSEINQFGLIDIYTNGLFLKKEYEKIYDEYIRLILWHVAIDENHSIEKWYEGEKIIPGIVFDNWNEQIIQSYIEKYPLLKFKGFENTIPNRNIDVDFYTKFSDVGTVQDIKGIKNLRKLCNSLHPVITINLARRTLTMCSTQGINQSIPLTEENMKKILTENNVFQYNEICDTCVRNCIFDATEFIKIKSKFKKRLKNVG